ncbi:MAG: UDP-N-acetylmuramate--L-alanine ligase [Patescibacteria group bacterium]
MTKKLHVHFVGIGGIGMSALARWFLAKNWAVSGSDLADSEILKELRKEGVKVKIGHKKSNLPAHLLEPKAKPTSMVIYSSAIKPDNPELREARKFGIKPMSYAETIGCLTKPYKTIAVAGSHGKSTTTSLLGLIVIRAGMNPTIIVGTKLKELRGKNFLSGKSNVLVLEADEWKAAFLHYSPFIAIVTNIDREHLDFYKDLNAVKKSFLQFLKNTKPEGFLVLNRDDRNVRSLSPEIKKIATQNNLRVIWFSIQEDKALVREIKKIINIPGEHNVSNALAACTVAIRCLGIKKAVALKTIGAYRGAWRRFEYKGKYDGALIFDDYAHHPTEIKATLKAFKEKYPKKKLLCVFQPHQAKRLQALFREFQDSFSDADEVLIFPSYQVAGRDEPSSRFNARALVAAIQKRHPHKLIFYLANPRDLKKKIHTLPSPLRSKVIVMMGAGDIVSHTSSLLRRP